MSGPYGFTSWNYGYTLCPQTGSQFYQPPNAPRGFVPRGRGGGRGQHFSRGSRGGQQHQPQPKEVKVESQEVKAEPPAEVKAETAAAGPTSVVGPPSAVEANNEKEEGEIVERPIEEILRGRNAVMYCNDQSKMRGLRMEWEQVSETGPPHDKTFTWSLKMGDMMTTGSANNKKGAKNKSAEEMARKLDKLPKTRGGRFNAGGPPRGGGFQPNFGHGAGYYGMPPYQGPPYGQVPPSQWMMPQGGPAKKRKFSEVAPAGPTSGVGAAAVAAPAEGPEAKVANAATTSSEIAARLNFQSLNNPISKLYEYCKQRKLPEPHFETMAENVIEKRKTSKGFVLKKTEFTIQVDVMGKKFMGTAMTKKQAKYNASEAAWAEFGGGVPQASIESLLQGSRTASNATA